MEASFGKQTPYLFQCVVGLKCVSKTMNLVEVGDWLLVDLGSQFSHSGFGLHSNFGSFMLLLFVYLFTFSFI